MRPRRLRVPDGLREQRFEPRHRALPVDHSSLPSQPIRFFPLFPPHAFLAPAPRVGNLALLARVGWPGEAVRLGRVEDLPGLGEGLPSPALLVVGKVVGLYGELLPKDHGL